MDRSYIKKTLLEEIDDFDWVEPTSPKSLDDDELHRIYYVARKAELISELISGNVYIKIQNPEKYSDLQQMFFDMGYRKFDGSQKISKHHGLGNYWRKGNYLIVYNNGVTDKTIDYQRKSDMDPKKIRRGSDFSLSI
jgi:hypothetical protein